MILYYENDKMKKVICFILIQLRRPLFVLNDYLWLSKTDIYWPKQFSHQSCIPTVIQRETFVVAKDILHYLNLLFLPTIMVFII